MDSFLKFQFLDEYSNPLDLFTNHSHYSVLCVLSFLLISYSIYSKVIWSALKKTKLPKLYKITALHSLWMGSTHLVITILCFSQLQTFIPSLFSANLSKPAYISKLLYAATANFCRHSIEYNINSSEISNAFQNSSISSEGILEWTTLNSLLVIVIYAVLIQEILLATRHKMDYTFYSRLLKLIFVASAVRTRCPVISIQGIFLMSINSSSKETARALVAWKSYSQDDSDHKPSPVMKAVAFILFVFHMVIWSSLILFYMPFFIHKFPTIVGSDPTRLFLAYAYLSFLAYIVLEVGTSPLWTTIRCMGWCRRSCGFTWRLLSLSDCHLLGHYGSLVLELYNIQVILDQRKALFRNKMVQKHLASLEGRKRKSSSELQARRPASLLAAVKTVVALKKKLQRRIDDMPTRSVSLENLPQVELKTGDSNYETDHDKEALLIDDPNLPKIVIEEVVESVGEDTKEFANDENKTEDEKATTDERKDSDDED